MQGYVAIEKYGETMQHQNFFSDSRMYIYPVSKKLDISI